MQQTGIEDEQVVLLLEDHQFVDGQFLELLNSLLSAGEVPGLYSPEELDPLLTPLRDQVSELGFRGTVAQYFATSQYNNLLIISAYYYLFLFMFRGQPPCNLDTCMLKF